MSDESTRCIRCGEPKHRAAAHAIYCAGCAGVVYRERLRRQKRAGGSREQFGAMMAAWRDGTIARVLERMEAAGD
jgi:hypothetical protein